MLAYWVFDCQLLLCIGKSCLPLVTLGLISFEPQLPVSVYPLPRYMQSGHLGIPSQLHKTLLPQSECGSRCSLWASSLKCFHTLNDSLACISITCHSFWPLWCEFMVVALHSGIHYQGCLHCPLVYGESDVAYW